MAREGAPALTMSLKMGDSSKGLIRRIATVIARIATEAWWLCVLVGFMAFVLVRVFFGTGGKR